MKGLPNFPISLRISIPAILIVCGGLLGITSFNQEINEAYQKTEINTKKYVQIRILTIKSTCKKIKRFQGLLVFNIRFLSV